MADPDLRPGHEASDAHGNGARANHLAPAQLHREAHEAPGGGNHLDPGHVRSDAHPIAAGVTLSCPEPACERSPMEGRLDERIRCAPSAADAHLLVLADVLDDLERARIAAENRLRALTDAKGLDPFIDGGRMQSLVERLAALEADCTKQLERTMRHHPLGPWVKETVGVGAKQAARLLAAVGDPAERPNVAKFWQYCGHGDPARSHLRKGRPVEHSPQAKMRAHLIAESCIKQAHSPYRPVYDAAREAWVDRETTDLHKHNHALRLVAKAMLRDLWVAARQASGHSRSDTHSINALGAR